MVPRTVAVSLPSCRLCFSDGKSETISSESRCLKKTWIGRTSSQSKRRQRLMQRVEHVLKHMLMKHGLEQCRKVLFWLIALSRRHSNINLKYNCIIIYQHASPLVLFYSICLAGYCVCYRFANHGATMHQQ